MNCTECQDDLVAFIEGLMDREAALECQSHLEVCAGCRAEHKAIINLQQRLTRVLGATKLPSIGPVSLAKAAPRSWTASCTTPKPLPLPGGVTDSKTTPP
jgi:anti-sigma factor RsiW